MKRLTLPSRLGVKRVLAMAAGLGLVAMLLPATAGQAFAWTAPGITPLCSDVAGTYNWTVTLASGESDYAFQTSPDGIKWGPDLQGVSGDNTVTTGSNTLWVRWSGDPGSVTGPVINTVGLCTPPPPGGEILPTNTECSDFVNNTTPALAGIFYKDSGGNIAQSINPGVFFYYTYVTTTAPNQPVTTSQHATNSAPLFSLNQGHIWVYTAPNCVLVSQPTQSGTSVSFTIATPGTYVLRLQYSTKSIAGKTAPNASPSLYTFDINNTDNASVPLILQ